MQAPNRYVFQVMIVVFCLGAMPLLWGGMGLLGRMRYADKDYACHIETKVWVVTEAQLREAFAKREDPVQLTCRNFESTRIYYLIRLRNLGPCWARGTLEISGDLSETAFDVMRLEPCCDEPVYYSFPIGKLGFSAKEKDLLPTVSVNWKHLYVKSCPQVNQ